jgi:hypothetical protein
LTRYAIRRNGDFTERIGAVKAKTGQRGTQPCPGAHYQQVQVARFAGQELSAGAIQQRLSGVHVHRDLTPVWASSA